MPMARSKRFVSLAAFKERRADRVMRDLGGDSMPPIDVLAAIIEMTDRSLDWLPLGKRPDRKP